MSNFYEIDFLPVQSSKSGDAITIRYQAGTDTVIHVVDAGFQKTGESVVEHIKKYHNNPSVIHHVVATHNDGDHAGGLRSILEEFEVKNLWINLPWDFADELIHRFVRFTNVENLEVRLKEIYPNLAVLEEMAKDKGIEIRGALQGQKIGEFTVLSPSKELFLEKIVESDKTPEAIQNEEDAATIDSMVEDAIRGLVRFVKSLWGVEQFSDNETSAENEMSVVQFAELCGDKILLTGDAGRASLSCAADYAPAAGLHLPGIDVVQVPHHGSRRNLSTEILDRFHGPILDEPPSDENWVFTAYVSASEDDEHHPRNAVIRSYLHRGGGVFPNGSSTYRKSKHAPKRDGWGPIASVGYPDEIEEDW